MTYGKLKEMGHLTTIDIPDDARTDYKYALLIEFDSVSEIRQAIADGACTFGWGEDRDQDCSGDPDNCPNNEGRGCECTDRARMAKNGEMRIGS